LESPRIDVAGIILIVAIILAMGLCGGIERGLIW